MIWVAGGAGVYSLPHNAPESNPTAQILPSLFGPPFIFPTSPPTLTPPPLSLSLSIPLIIQKRSSSFLLRERKRRCCWERGHGLPWRETLAWPSSPLISPTLLLTRPILTTPSPLPPTPTVLLINNAYLLLLPLPSPSLLETTAAIPQTSQLILLTSWDLAPSVNAVWFLVVISICIGI